MVYQHWPINIHKWPFSSFSVYHFEFAWVEGRLWNSAFASHHPQLGLSLVAGPLSDGMGWGRGFCFRWGWSMHWLDLIAEFFETRVYFPSLSWVANLTDASRLQRLGLPWGLPLLQTTAPGFPDHCWDFSKLSCVLERKGYAEIIQWACGVLWSLDVVDGITPNWGVFAPAELTCATACSCVCGDASTWRFRPPTSPMTRIFMRPLPRQDAKWWPQWVVFIFWGSIRSQWRSDKLHFLSLIKTCMPKENPLT